MPVIICCLFESGKLQVGWGWSLCIERKGWGSTIPQEVSGVESWQWVISLSPVLLLYIKSLNWLKLYFAIALDRNVSYSQWLVTDGSFSSHFLWSLAHHGTTSFSMDLSGEMWFAIEWLLRWSISQQHSRGNAAFTGFIKNDLQIHEKLQIHLFAFIRISTPNKYKSVLLAIFKIWFVRYKWPHLWHLEQPKCRNASSSSPLPSLHVWFSS